MTGHARGEGLQRIRAVAAETALAEAEAHIAELHQQLDRANAACVRIARRIALPERKREAA